MKTSNFFISIFLLAFSVSFSACNSETRSEAGTTAGTATTEQADAEAAEVDVKIGTEDLENETRSIIQAMQSQGNLSTFISLVESARMVETLDAIGPFTVFAPSDEAFAQLPKGNLERMTNNMDQQELKTMIGHHMMSRRLVQSDVEKGITADMLGGENLPLRIENGRIMLGDAHVITQSIPAKNGVIHIIDRVLIPESVQPVE